MQGLADGTNEVFSEERHDVGVVELARVSRSHRRFQIHNGESCGNVSERDGMLSVEC